MTEIHNWRACDNLEDHYVYSWDIGQELKDAHRWAAAWKRIAKLYRADATNLRAKLRKWKHRAKKAEATRELDPHVYAVSSEEAIPSQLFITDGHFFMLAICPNCGGKRVVVRPGDIRCQECGK